MEEQYRLEVENQSGKERNICLYQTDPVQERTNIFSLAWFSKSVSPKSNVHFDWKPQYAIFYENTGILQQGIPFQAEGMKKIDLSIPAKTARALTIRDGQPEFIQTDEFVPAGEIGLFTSRTVPDGQYAFGVGMAGNPAFATVARPDMAVNFRPHPRYWVAAGDYQQGEVIKMDSSAVPLPSDLSNGVYKVVVQENGELKLEGK